MKIDYSALKDAAKVLAAASAQVHAEPAAPGELGSGAAAPNEAHRTAASDRRSTLLKLSELMTAQSESCTEMTTLFKLLDAQIASQVKS